MSNEPINEGMKELTELFVAEGFDLIDDAESKIGSLHAEYDDEIVNTIFRMFHSIKGSAAFLNFGNIKNITHEAETLLDIFRQKKRIPRPEEVDLLFQTCDFLRQLIVSVDGKLSDEGHENDVALMVNDIKQCIVNLRNDMDTVASGGELRMFSARNAVPETIINAEMIEKFIAESAELLDRTESALLSLEKNPDNIDLINEAFRSIHTIKGNSGFFAFSKIEEESGEIETFLDLVRCDQRSINNNLITFLLNKVDSIRAHVRSVQLTADNDEPAEEDGAGDDGYKPLGQILVEMGAANEETIEKALENQENRLLGEILVNDGMVDPAAVDTALKIQQQYNNRTLESGQRAVKRRDIRVATDKLDKLFDLVGELITAEAMVSQHPALQTLNDEGLNKSVGYLNKITRELQEISMSARMIPLDGTFTKMVRLVRDLSRKSGKEVRLELSGQDTEMDRTVTEEISDPLVHIIRNSIDHGIETREERIAAGKKPAGTIFLEAHYEGNEIWVSVSDDGRGLNREKIIAKGVERGLIPPNMDISDDAAWRLIFEPGFSTAEQITDVSGRGVGMDVVKRNIEKLRGKIDIVSTRGEGTSIILKIPLTMAIIDGITVRVGAGLYSIPTVDILEFFKADEQQITRVDRDLETILLRGEILPVLKLHQIFRIATEKTETVDGILIVIQNNGRKACLLIDEIVGSQQLVLKSLSDCISREQKGLAGCSLMGNGDISLIIDTGEVMNSWLQ